MAGTVSVGEAGAVAEPAVGDVLSMSAEVSMSFNGICVFGPLSSASKASFACFSLTAG